MLELLVEGAGVGGVVSKAGFGAIDPAPSDGSEEASFVTGVAEHFPDHERCGGFTVGAGDSNDAEVLGGVVMLLRGGKSLEPV